MILNLVFSKPAKNIEEILSRPYIRVRIKKHADSYQAEFFTEKQSFQKNMSEEEVMDFYKKNAGTTFKNAVMQTETEEITTMANRHGEIKTLTKKISQQNNHSSIPLADIKRSPGQHTGESFNRKKNYILEEGTPVPFLVELGVMSKEGKVLSQRYDKFRQINRFLEFIRDIIAEVTKIAAPDHQNFTQERPLYIADFGCGKSYLTFAVYHYLHEMKKIPVVITGLDLKKDVVEHCQSIAQKLGYENLFFKTGDVCEAENYYNHSPDIMITLHACDTATDYALNYAVTNNTAAILSVPCCQHEINLQYKSEDSTDSFSSLRHWGILRERFSALATDAIRAELLEQKDYKVQLLEFIDFEGTPKNLLIRAVKRQTRDTQNTKSSCQRLDSLMQQLKCTQTLVNLMEEK